MEQILSHEDRRSVVEQLGQYSKNKYDTSHDHSTMFYLHMLMSFTEMYRSWQIV